jgi:uncharacterized membrane protein YkoI
MGNKGFLALAVAAGLLVSTQAAFAVDQEDVRALNASRMSITQAIDAAAKQGNGRPIDAEFARKGAAAHFDVKVLTQDKVMKYTVDANSGQVTGTSEQTIETFFTRMKPEDLRNTQTSLIQAIGAAEQRAQGKAIQAEAERDQGHISYEITVAKADGSTHKIKVDGQSGQVAEK